MTSLCFLYCFLRTSVRSCSWFPAADSKRLRRKYEGNNKEIILKEEERGLKRQIMYKENAVECVCKFNALK